LKWNFRYQSLQKRRLPSVYPAWSKSSKLSINGEAIENLQPGTYAKIKRSWQNGDKISLELDMRGRVIETLSPAHSIAIMRGPIVLARDARFSGPGIEAVLKPVKDADGFVTLTETTNTTGDDIWMLYNTSFIPESHTENGAPPVGVILLRLRLGRQRKC
jgi:DUF1680 family protein